MASAFLARISWKGKVRSPYAISIWGLLQSILARSGDLMSHPSCPYVSQDSNLALLWFLNREPPRYLRVDKMELANNHVLLAINA